MMPWSQVPDSFGNWPPAAPRHRFRSRRFFRQLTPARTGRCGRRFFRQLAGAAARLGGMRPARRRLILFSAAVLAALTVVLAVVLPAGTASAASAAGPKTRVWAFSLAALVHVRADRLVSAGQHLGDAAACPFYASGACNVPEAAGAAGGGGGGGITPMFRVSPVERGTSELDSGLNPANFPRSEELDGAAHFGNPARVQDFVATHADTHGVGMRIDVPSSWLSHPDIQIWEGRTPDQLEYVIPRELFGQLNQFPRFPWSPGA